MLRIVNLGRTGLYVVMNGGTLASLGGRSWWNSLDELRAAAKKENVAVSDHVLHTVH
ncbi:MAG TPA: hypothetical protein VD995_33710 [Azospirillum sp.]|nr:hypothetical protein [Azospirillum sp.]